MNDQDDSKRRNIFEDAQTLDEVVFQAIGAGSSCWETLDGTGVFQSSDAKRIGEDAVARIAQLQLRDDVGRDVDPGLLDALQDLGDEYGPLGVATVAAQLSDVNMVMVRLRAIQAEKQAALYAQQQQTPDVLTREPAHVHILQPDDPMVPNAMLTHREDMGLEQRGNLDD